MIENIVKTVFYSFGIMVAIYCSLFIIVVKHDKKEKGDTKNGRIDRTRETRDWK